MLNFDNRDTKNERQFYLSVDKHRCCGCWENGAVENQVNEFLSFRYKTDAFNPNVACGGTDSCWQKNGVTFVRFRKPRMPDSITWSQNRTGGLLDSLTILSKLLKLAQTPR